jgi:UDP-galactopyranose mutase
MSSQLEYLIVGAGLTGATIAHFLKAAGRSVLVVDRRAEAGGNVHDHIHESGVRIHTYGPHYFRTNSSKLWRFVNRLSPFYRYEPVVKSFVDGRYETWPLTEPQIERLVGKDWRQKLDVRSSQANFEESCLARMPKKIYEKFVYGYSLKQWGVAPECLSAQLGQRIPIRKIEQEQFLDHLYQGIPQGGYNTLTRALLRDIPLVLNFDYLAHPKIYAPLCATIYTGPIDEYFGRDLGTLKYRGQKRTQEYLPDVVWRQPCGQVNFPSPDDGAQIRCLEWKHMMEAELQAGVRGTVLTYETPITPDDPNDFEYPFPDSVNASLYERYKERALGNDRVLFCGRLGNYRYYDMDQAIAAATQVAQRLLNTNLSII